MSYKKHNLYWGAYEADPDNFIGLDNSRWVVRKYVNDSEAHGEVCLILEDEQQSFWPVMSFLNEDEVKKLIEELQKYV